MAARSFQVDSRGTARGSRVRQVWRARSEGTLKDRLPDTGKISPEPATQLGRSAPEQAETHRKLQVPAPVGPRQDYPLQLQ